MLKVSRREFLGLVGTIGAFALIGCSRNEPQDDKKTMISALALENYELLTCEDENMIVKYQPEVREFKVIKLDIIDGSFEEIEIYKNDIDETKDRLDIFYAEHGVLDHIPALQAVEELYGKKSYYTVNEVAETIDKKSTKKVFTKSK